MSNLVKRSIALVLLLTHLLTSCGRWETGECGRGEPGGPNECKAPGQPHHGSYIEDNPGVGLMTQEGFMSAFNRIYKEDYAPINEHFFHQVHYPLNFHTNTSYTPPIIPSYPISLSTSQSSPLVNQRSINLHLPVVGYSNNSLTQQFLASGATRDMISSLWDLGRTLANYSDEVSQIKRYHEEAADRAIADMRGRAEESRRKQEEFSQKFALEQAQKEEKHKLEAKAQKEKEKKEREERLQKLIARRKEVENGAIKVIKPANHFIANASISNVKRSQESINNLRKRIAANSATKGLTNEQPLDLYNNKSKLDSWWSRYKLLIIEMMRG